MRSIHRLLLVWCIGVATASSVHSDICPDQFCVSSNGGFEEAGPSGELPKAWRLRSNSSSAVTLASTSAHSGAHGLLLEKADAVPPVAIEQAIARPIAGNSILQLEAWLRSETGPVQVGGLYVNFQVPGDDKPGFASTFRSPLAGAGNWEQRSLAVRLPAGATDVRFGAAVVTTAKVSIDDVSAVLFDATSQNYEDRNQQATYLSAAIDEARKTAINSARLDWPLLEKQTRFLARNAVTAADVHPALEFLAAALEDGHSHFIAGAPVKAGAAPAPAAFALPTAKTIDGVGYIALPGLATTNPDAGDRYVASAWQQIAASRDAKGWILDLRGNGGGNVHPMLMAMAPFLGDGELAAYVIKDRVTPYRLAQEKLRDLQAKYPYPGDHLKDRVVVLVGKNTRSSGEMVAIAFRRRANTCIVGEKTAGLATVVRQNVLSDGSSFNITVGMMADSAGQTYPDGVEPDRRLVSGGKEIEEALTMLAGAC